MPRSTSRDWSDRFIGFRHYFKDWTGIESWKMRLSLFATICVVVWVVFTFLSERNRHTQQSPGEVASPHQQWNQQCEACHQPKAGMFFASGWNQLSCQECHKAAKHHASIPDGDLSEQCASCHKDHNGKDFSLVKLNDSACVRCHNKIEGTKYHATVTNFAVDHPEFKLPTSRPSTIKFSHAQHMSSGIVAIAGGKNPMMKDGKPVQLACADCHTPSIDGKYFQPIDFNTHCQSCHEQKAPSAIIAKTEVVPPVDLLHGLTFNQVEARLKADYSLALQKRHPKLKDAANAIDPATRDFLKEVETTTASSMKFITANCQYCHITNNDQIAKANIPDIWMKHSTFNHESHRKDACVTCHPQSGTVSDREPINIPGIKSCQECHSPKSGDKGGVRHNCTDCHTYHNGDEAIHRKVQTIRTIPIRDILKPSPTKLP